MNKAKIGLAKNDTFRYYYLDSTELVKTVIEKQQTNPIASVVVGKFTTVTAIMGLMLKRNQSLTATVDSDGLLGKVICTTNSVNQVKTFVQFPDFDITENIDIHDVMGTVGNIRVVKDLNLKEPYMSETSIMKGDVATDFAYYFAVSEQTPTAISCSITVDENLNVVKAAGLLIQAMPGATEADIKDVSEKLATIKMVSEVEDPISIVFDDYREIAEADTEFYCDCSYERYLTALRMLSAHDLEDIKKDETVECSCHFCNNKYNILTSEI